VNDRTLRWLLLAPALLIVGATLAWPLGYALWISLHDWRLSRSPVPGPFVGLEQYEIALTDDPELWESLAVTGIFVVSSVTATLLVAMAMALLLAGGGRLTSAARTLLVIPFAMSPALVGISWRFLLNPEYGAISAVVGGVIPSLRGVALLADPTLAMIALVASDVWHWAPYFMLMFVGALAALPQDTVDAAQVDGAPAWRVLFDVVLPQLWPVLAIALLLKTIFSLKLLDQVVTLTNGGPGTATNMVSHFVYLTAFRWFDLAYASAIAFMLAAVTAAIAAIYARLLMRAPA
jgi:multiple sugar transport system permease protein